MRRLGEWDRLRLIRGVASAGVVPRFVLRMRLGWIVHCEVDAILRLGGYDLTDAHVSSVSERSRLDLAPLRYSSSTRDRSFRKQPHNLGRQHKTTKWRSSCFISETAEKSIAEAAHHTRLTQGATSPSSKPLPRRAAPGISEPSPSRPFLIASRA